MEGPEDCAFCALRRFRMVDTIDEEGETEDVGEEDELLRWKLRTWTDL